MTPKSYKARFIEPGIISYNDQGEGVVFVSKEALDRMTPTFKGCPVIFVPEHHDGSTPETAFNFEDAGNVPPAGIVASDPYWGDDGWQWVNLLIWDEDACRKIDSAGYSVSCAYWMDQAGPGGDWHNIKYDEELEKGHYLHMAIVPRPRYEGSQIRANSKGGPNVAKRLFKIFGGKAAANAAPEPPKKPEAAPAAEKKPEGEMLNADSSVKLPDGSEVSLSELIAAYKESGTEEPLDMDDMVDVDGKQVAVSELVAAYQAKQGGTGEPAEPLENSDPPTNTPADDVVDPAKQGPGVRSNAAPARSVNPAIKNAAAKPGDSGATEEHPETRADRIARGSVRYSRSVAQEARK